MYNTVNFIFTFDSFGQELQQESCPVTGLHRSQECWWLQLRPRLRVGSTAVLVECDSECLYLLSGLEERLYTNQRILHSSSSKGLGHTHTKNPLQQFLLEPIHGRSIEKGICGIFTQKDCSCNKISKF